MNKDKINNRRIIDAMRDEIIDNIVAILKRNASFEPDFLLGCNPIIIDASDGDDNNSMTLDRVALNGESFSVDCSSCWDSSSADAEFLPVEVLQGILDFLEENEDNIWCRDSDSVSAAIYDAVMDEYRKQDNCMGDFLGMTAIGDILLNGHPEVAGFLPALSPGQLAELYMSLKHNADGDEFYRENDCCDERLNILDGKKEKLSDLNRVFVLFNEVNNDGVRGSEVIGTYRSADDARAEMKSRRDIFMSTLSDDEIPVKENGDDFVDSDDRFLYYHFNHNHLFALDVKETEIQ